MNCEMKCDMCKESVNYGDDYRTHLQFAHSVTNNFPFFMNKALEKLKLEARKTTDIVALEEEDHNVSGPSRSNQKVSEADVSDEKTEAQIEKTIEKTLVKDNEPVKATPVPLSSNETPLSKPDPSHSPRPQTGGAKNIPGKLAPVRSDKSDTEAGKFQTFFICPLETCSFSTSKQGMKGGKAATHLKELHKISGSRA